MTADALDRLPKANPSPATSPPATGPDPIQGHRAETDRLGKLTEFLNHFAPAIGQASQPGRSAEQGVSLGLLSARDLAIRESFRAVERIARESFQFPQKGPP